MLRAPVLVPLLPLLCLLTACGSAGPTRAAGPTASPVPTGSVPAAALKALLLQSADLPTLTTRREFASADLSTQAAPQLALCRPAAPVAPHELASVLAKPPALGQVQVFEVVSVFAAAADAHAAFAQAATDTHACPSYAVEQVPYRVEQLAAITLAGADESLHYRLTTPSVVSGDVRTLSRSGRYLVLVTGYGAPPQGQDLLGYQAAAMTKALARLS